MSKPSLELSSHWKAELAGLFVRFSPEFEVWAYGSRVTGQHHDASDLDLVLLHPLNPETRRCENFLDLRNALIESNLPISVDLMDWARLPEAFHQQINRGKIMLFPSVMKSPQPDAPDS